MATGRPDPLPDDYPDHWREVEYFLIPVASEVTTREEAQVRVELGYRVTVHSHRADEPCHAGCERYLATKKEAT